MQFPLFITYVKRNSTTEIVLSVNETDIRSYTALQKTALSGCNYYFVGEYSETRGKALTINKMMLFLRFQGNPGYQNGFAEDIGVIRSTVAKTTSFVLGKFIDKYKEWL